jgi:UDP-3-O-[3-hydroxymyristoyl] glucosamine N-acyltransferase
MIDYRFYKNSGPLTLQQILEITQGKAVAQERQQFKDVATLSNAKQTDVSFFHNKKYLSDLKNTKAGLVCCSSEFMDVVPAGTIALETPTPYRAYAQIAAAFYPTAEVDLFHSQAVAISPHASLGENVTIGVGAVVGPGARIGGGTHLGASCVIGPGVEIGKNCFIGAHVSISHALIGDHVTLSPGARVGQAGFGFFMDEKGHVAVPQLGRVIIEDGVEVGSNSTIARGTLEDTIIGAGTRIDTLVQIAHGVRLGRGCVIVAQVGISGSTTLGNFVIAAGQAGLTGHLQIGDKVRISAQAGVMRDIPPGETVGGTPAVPIKQWHRQSATLAKIANEKHREKGTEHAL